MKLKIQKPCNNIKYFEYIFLDMKFHRNENKTFSMQKYFSQCQFVSC